ncbi:dynamin associated protein 160 isoform X2 [Dermatophagoides pteronyssinus]|uniref:dynamin associated protein 160 isoform X2 n=1 Tax=Dermatophagoides pteronyssinus TaxID=6956 RepID=UPI003F672CF3
MTTTLKSPTNESSLFIISPEQKAKYEAQFKKLCPTGDFINGQQAREILLQSKLSPQILAHIWNLSDVDADGRLDINEFSIALHLIALKLKGVELPTILPQSLKVLVEPPPPFATFNSSSEPINIVNSLQQQQQQSSTTMVMKPTTTAVGMSPSNSVQQMKSTMTKSSTSPITVMAEWSIPQPIKLKYTQMFNSHDRQRTGFLTGIQARNILLESKLPQTILAQIWNLSDVDTDGRLTCEEFVLAMYLVDKAKRQESLPAKLPPDLVPPSYRRSGSGTLSHTSSLDDPSSEHNDLSMGNKSSFEDKRRENYEKGQAELDRRRAALQEQERRQREERERKEREENLRKEKERLEAERRRQEELELQRQKLLEQELEREEQKRRQQEVRELARKEMERQRQRELEQARRTELLTQRSRLTEELQKFKSRRKVLILEHEQIDKQLNESKKLAQTSRDRVVRLKTEIDGMRIKRDQTLAKQTQIKSQMKLLTEKQLIVEQEKVRLAAQLKSLIANGTNNGINAEQQLTSFVSILQAKQSQINQLRSQLERMQEEYKIKKEDVLNSKQELERLKQMYQEKRRKASKFQQQLEDKRIEAEKVRDGKASSKYAADTDVAWGQEVPTNFEWPSQQNDDNKKIVDNNQQWSNQNQINPTATNSIRTKFRYRCVFEFEARNSDEITIKPGDLIIVDTSACSEEGWLSGEINGKIGWFPKDYAVLDEDNDDKKNNEQQTAVLTKAENAEDIREAIALYDLSSNETGHLSFQKDDHLRITQQQDSWFFGDLLDSNGHTIGSGWFPESYVQISTTSSNPVVVGDKNLSQSSSSSSQYYVSLFAFESVEPGDLGFDVNELIKIEKQDGDWWTGVIIDRNTGKEDENRRGIFPSNFVGPADPSEIPRKESESITDSPKPTKKSKAKKQEIVQAVASYTATGPEQLSLEIGQLIQVRKKTQTGWWEGELQAKGKKKQVGWFPASYVKPLGSGVVIGGTGGGGVTVATSVSPVAAAAVVSTTTTETSKNPNDEIEIERVQALYAFNAQRNDEISFEKDDIIRVLSKTDPTWWRGHNIRTNAVGLFPSNHVQPVSNNDGGGGGGGNSDITSSSYEHYSLSMENPDQFINDDNDDSFDDDNDNDGGSEDDQQISVQPNHLFNNNNDDNMDDDSFDDDTSDEIDDNNDNMEHYKSVSLKNYNKNDNRMENFNETRRNLIFELISTEHDYIKDLYFVIENYANRIEKSQLISSKDFELIFNHLEDIYDVNRLFFKDLSERLRESLNRDFNFCDLFHYYLEQMKPNYQKFFTNQINASKRLQNLIETNRSFENLLRQISIETKSHLPLSSYLIKPMQRITKYPLLIEKILQYTPKNHDDFDDCQKTLEFAKKFCSDLNETCRKTDNFDKLHWIQQHVRITSKLFPRSIDFNSETQFLGPRTLIRVGILIKSPSSRVLVGFLFNDFFMLVTPDKSGLKLRNVTNFFQTKRAYSTTYTLYRKPMILDQFQLADLIGFEQQLSPSLFRLYLPKEKRYLNLRSHSHNDCTQWLNDIHRAQQTYKDILSKLKRNNIISVGKPIGSLFITIVEAVQIYTINPEIDVQIHISIGHDWDHITGTFQTPIIQCPKGNSLRNNSFNRMQNNVNNIRTSSSSSSTSSSSTNNNVNISSSSTTTQSSFRGPYRIEWNYDSKLLFYNFDDYLLIRCTDVNPFEPNRCLGERRLLLRDLFNESNSIGGTITQNIQLHAPQNQERFMNLFDHSHQHCRPSLLIKYKFLVYSQNNGNS